MQRTGYTGKKKNEGNTFYLLCTSVNWEYKILGQACLIALREVKLLKSLWKARAHHCAREHIWPAVWTAKGSAQTPGVEGSVSGVEGFVLLCLSGWETQNHCTVFGEQQPKGAANSSQKSLVVKGLGNLVAREGWRAPFIPIFI